MELPFDIIASHVIPLSGDKVKLLVATTCKKYDEIKPKIKLESFYELNDWTHSFRIKRGVLTNSATKFPHPENIRVLILMADYDLKKFTGLKKLIITKEFGKPIFIPASVSHVKVECEKKMRLVFEKDSLEELIIEEAGGLEMEGLLFVKRYVWRSRRGTSIIFSDYYTTKGCQEN